MPGWLKALLEILAKAFLGFIREQGRAEVRKEIDDEQQRRIDMANAARADADQFATGGLRDPRQRD